MTKVIFESLVFPEPNTGCWIWGGSYFDSGYGRYSNQRAHRISFKIYNGDIPKNYFVCHSCDNKFCVNPNHLFIGTAKDNAQDRKIKGRNGNLFGENNPISKLTKTDVLVIREANTMGFKKTHLSRYFNLSFGAIHKLINNKTWKTI